MNNKHLPEKRKGIIAFVLYFLIVLSCTKTDLSDPFWHINLNWDRATVTEVLYNKSKNGDLENCVFSFYKEFYIKNQEMDAKVKATLNNPTFIKNNIKSLDYTLIALFRDETTTKFNPHFFDYFIEQMTSAYGVIYQENTEGDKINLTWKKKNGISINATIFRDINSYNISVKLKN